MGEVPPADRLGVFDRDDFANGEVLADQATEEDVMWGVAEDVADADDFGRVGGEALRDGETVG